MMGPDDLELRVGRGGNAWNSTTLTGTPFSISLCTHLKRLTPLGDLLWLDVVSFRYLKHFFPIACSHFAVNNVMGERNLNKIIPSENTASLELVALKKYNNFSRGDFHRYIEGEESRRRVKVQREIRPASRRSPRSSKEAKQTGLQETPVLSPLSRLQKFKVIRDRNLRKEAILRKAVAAVRSGRVRMSMDLISINNPVVGDDQQKEITPGVSDGDDITRMKAKLTVPSDSESSLVNGNSKESQEGKESEKFINGEDESEEGMENGNHVEEAREDKEEGGGSTRGGTRKSSRKHSLSSQTAQGDKKEAESDQEKDDGKKDAHLEKNEEIKEIERRSSPRIKSRKSLSPSKEEDKREKVVNEKKEKQEKHKEEKGESEDEYVDIEKIEEEDEFATISETEENLEVEEEEKENTKILKMRPSPPLPPPILERAKEAVSSVSGSFSPASLFWFAKRSPPVLTAETTPSLSSPSTSKLPSTSFSREMFDERSPRMYPIGQRISSRRSLKRFNDVPQLRKRKAFFDSKEWIESTEFRDVEDEQNSAGKRRKGETITPSVASPGWRFFQSSTPFSRMWKNLDVIETDSMVVNFDDESIHDINDESNVMPATTSNTTIIDSPSLTSSSSPSKKWKCSIM